MASRHPNLEKFWDQNVSGLAGLEETPPTPEKSERHRIFSLLLMAITHHYWCGNKYGRAGTYPWNDDPTTAQGEWLDREYRGHNIAALAVGPAGKIIDFELNHNKLFNSSAEHAEARLVKRVYEFGQVSDSWGVTGRPQALSDYNTFENVVVYTSLESCSQCSGIMALARVWKVVYLQTDPGMYMIGNMLRNLTKGTGLESPIPIPAGEIELGQFTGLDDAFQKFREQLEQQPFHISPAGKKRTRHSITSFLCTRMSRAIYAQGAADFEALTEKSLAHPNFKAPDREGNPVGGALTNGELLTEARDFYSYATASGRRATPHK